MRNLLRALLVLVLLSVVAPGHAEPACGSDTSSDPDAALGKDVWLNGYCQAFLPCRLALEQFHGCQAAESFLSKLGAKQDVPLTEQQVQSALSQTAGAAADAPKAKAPMSRNIAGIERERVSEMDNKAAALVQSNCGGFGCSNLLESTVDPVIREAAALNANPEYLAHMPRYAPIASVEAAARFGWAKQDGFWMQAAPQRKPDSASTTTLRDYLLSVDECKKLHDTLDREIKANSAEEPANLSFFEGECVPQLASYADDVRSWRALFALKPPLPQQAGAPVKAPELGQWHNGLVAEENRQVAAAEKQRQADAERQAEQAAAQKKEQLAAAERSRQAMPASSRHSSVCARNEAKIQQVIKSSGYGDYSGFGLENEEKIRLFAALHAPCAGDDASRSPGMGKSSRSIVEGLDKELEIHRENCSKFNSDCSRYFYDLHPGDSAESTRNYMQLYRSEVQRATSDPNYSADMEPANTNSQLPRASHASGDAECEAKLRAIDNQVSAATSGCGASASCNLEAAMWGLSQQISAIESYCPSGRYAAQLPDARKQLESVTTTCEQIVSGGRCSPKL